MSPTSSKERLLCALVACFAMSLAVTQQAWSQDSGGSETESTTTASAWSLEGVWDRENLTDDWFGHGPSLEESGITFGLSYQHATMVNMHGGLETTNGHDTGGSYILGFELDFEKMGLHDGLTFFMEALGTFGAEANDFDSAKIGGLTPTNTIAGSDHWIFVSKYWFRQRLHDNRAEIRLGLLDSFKDLFDTNEVAGSDERQFLNAALVGNRSIPHKTGMGAFLSVWPNDWLNLRIMAVDPQYRARRSGFKTGFHGDDAAQLFGEVAILHDLDSANGSMPGHYRVGTWYEGQSETAFGGLFARRTQSGDTGFYFGFDQMVCKENSEPNDVQGWSVFGRYGHAHGAYNRIENFWSFGGQCVGLVPERDEDVLGIGFAQSIQSDDYRKDVNPAADDETVYELYYAIRLNRWCVLTPDLQFITNPGGDNDDKDAFVAGLRLRLWF